MKKGKGFTLVELLAVIVILAIILAIAVPAITTITSNATKDAMANDAKLVAKAVDYQLLQNSSFDVTTINVGNVSTLLSGVSASNYQALNVTLLNGKPYVVIEGSNKWSNLMVVGTYTGMKVTDTTSTTYVNPPMLTTGMTPVKWNSGTSTWDTVSDPVNDTSWYDYANQKWANAKTADGSMWVWIPRYVYRISSNWHSNTTGTIDVLFSMGIDDTRGGTVTVNNGTGASASNNTYTNEPAFTFGSIQLTGMWVAKFEATAVEGVTNGYTADGSCASGADNVTTKTLKIAPNAISWRCLTIGTAFTVSRSLETNSTYGWGTSGSGIDTHLMKNVEWGAAAYLSKSIYGQSTNEVWINPANDYTTGCSGDTVNSSMTTGCLRTYDTTNGVKASTSGTIYGVYDMSGGSFERLGAYVNNGNGSLTTYGSSLVNAASQYKDVYTVGGTDDQPTNYGLTSNFKGDALYETSSAGNGSTAWFSDSSSATYSSWPFVYRGGRIDSGTGAGVFEFANTSGCAYSFFGFRPTLIIASGL